MQLRNLTSLMIASLLLSRVAFGQFPEALMEQQTSNENINGLAPWVPSFGTAPEQVAVNNGYLSVGGVGGAGQFFGVNGRSRYQVARCGAVKTSDGWCGFGVTYYDASWNEVGVQYKRITADSRFGGFTTLYTIGLVPPTNAVHAYLWIWNSDPTGYVIANGFKALNYFPEQHANFDDSAPLGNKYTQTFPADRNLIINGNFETQRRDIGFADYYQGDEFWNVVGDRTSVYFERIQVQDSFFVTIEPLGFRLGSETETNVIYQTVRDVQAGQPYALEIRSFENPSEEDAWVVVGVDFYDANGNKLGDAAKGLNGAPEVNVVNFTPPSGTVRTVVWVWAPPTGDNEAAVYLKSLAIRPR